MDRSSVVIRHLPDFDLARITEIDRSEHIHDEYVLVNGTLEKRVIDVDVPDWEPDGDAEHGIPSRLRAWRPVLERGGTLIGALDGERLAGIAVFEPDLEPGMDHLAVLYVSRADRRRGIGGLLVREVVRMARARGADRLYVSSSPTVSTVEFYRSHGFELARPANERMLRQEPDDIHLVRPL